MRKPITMSQVDGRPGPSAARTAGYVAELAQEATIPVYAREEKRYLPVSFAVTVCALKSVVKVTSTVPTMAPPLPGMTAAAASTTIGTSVVLVPCVSPSSCNGESRLMVTFVVPTANPLTCTPKKKNWVVWLCGQEKRPGFWPSSEMSMIRRDSSAEPDMFPHSSNNVKDCG